MIRKLMVPVFAALALVMVLGTVALAADEPVTRPNGPGQCVNFVDENGDGVCDNAGQQAGPRDGTGNQYGAGQRQGGMRMGQRQAGNGAGQGGNGAFVDADGDGVCDNLGQNVPPRDGTGRQNGAAQGQRSGRGGRP